MAWLPIPRARGGFDVHRQRRRGLSPQAGNEGEALGGFEVPDPVLAGGRLSQHAGEQIPEGAQQTPRARRVEKVGAAHPRPVARLDRHRQIAAETVAAHRKGATL